MTLDLFIDCEFDDPSQTLMSVGICDEMGRICYAFNRYRTATTRNQWVKDNVLPILENVPPGTFVCNLNQEGITFQHWFKEVLLQGYLGKYETQPDIVFWSDFPTDVTYISRLLHLGDGKRIGTMGRIDFRIEFIDPYPTKVEGAVQHNAAWDALVLARTLGYAVPIA